MAVFVSLPLCNALRFVPLEPANPSYSMPAFDRTLSIEQAQPNEVPTFYAQRFLKTDLVVFQVSTNSPVPPVLILKDCRGMYAGTVAPVANAVAPGYIVGGAVLTTYLFVFAGALVNGMLEEETYYGFLRVEDESGQLKEFASEPVQFWADLPGTLLFRYRHSSNKDGYLWEQFSAVPVLRVAGGIGTLAMGSKDVVAEGGNYDTTLLSSYQWRLWELHLGTGTGVPDWVGDKLSKILGCDFVQINGKEYSKVEGAPVEIKQVGGGQMRDVSAKLREADNGAGTEYSLAGNLLVADLPAVYPYAVGLLRTIFYPAGSMLPVQIVAENKVIKNTADRDGLIAGLNLSAALAGTTGTFFLARNSLYFSPEEGTSADVTHANILTKRFTIDQTPGTAPNAAAAAYQFTGGGMVIDWGFIDLYGVPAVQGAVSILEAIPASLLSSHFYRNGIGPFPAPVVYHENTIRTFVSQTAYFNGVSGQCPTGLREFKVSKAAAASMNLAFVTGSAQLKSLYVRDCANLATISGLGGIMTSKSTGLIDVRFDKNKFNPTAVDNALNGIVGAAPYYTPNGFLTIRDQTPLGAPPTAASAAARNALSLSGWTVYVDGGTSGPDPQPF